MPWLRGKALAPFILKIALADASAIFHENANYLANSILMPGPIVVETEIDKT